MRIKATLIKTSTDDGIVELNDEVEHGKILMVDLATLCIKEWPKPAASLGPTKRFSIFAFNCYECLEGYWMPLELLKLEAE